MFSEPIQGMVCQCLAHPTAPSLRCYPKESYLTVSHIAEQVTGNIANWSSVHFSHKNHIGVTLTTAFDPRLVQSFARLYGETRIEIETGITVASSSNRLQYRNVFGARRAYAHRFRSVVSVPGWSVPNATLQGNTDIHQAESVVLGQRNGFWII
jgi:hypothetical protein